MKIVKQGEVIENGCVEARGDSLERCLEKVSLISSEPMLGWTKISQARRGAFQRNGQQSQRPRRWIHVAYSVNKGGRYD